MLAYLFMNYDLNMTSVLLVNRQSISKSWWKVNFSIYFPVLLLELVVTMLTDSSIPKETSIQLQKISSLHLLAIIIYNRVMLSVYWNRWVWCCMGSIIMGWITRLRGLILTLPILGEMSLRILMNKSSIFTVSSVLMSIYVGILKFNMVVLLRLSLIKIWVIFLCSIVKIVWLLRL